MFFRFISAGIINASLSLLLYQIILLVLEPSTSYLLSWVAGFLFMLYFYPKKVFQTDKLTLKITVRITFIYLSSLLFGMILTESLYQEFELKQINIFIVLPITTIYNFLLMKRYVKN